MDKELQEDAQIIQGLEDGNPYVTDLLYRKYSSDIVNWAFQIIKHRSIAEDIRQDMFVTIQKKLSEGESFRIKGKNLSGYLYKMTRNECLNWMRGNQSHSVRNQVYGEKLQQVTDPVCLEEKERLTRLGKAIEELSPKKKEAVQLILVDGLKYKEAAEITGTSVNTLKIQVRDGKEELMNKLKRFFFLFL